MTARARPRQEKGYIEKPAAIRKGNGKAAAMALRAACSGIQNKVQTKTNGQSSSVKSILGEV